MARRGSAEAASSGAAAGSRPASLRFRSESGDFLVVAGTSRNGGPLCPVVGGECGECDGKVTALTLEYLGGITDAHVEVVQKKDDVLVFSGTVQPGETFLFVGADRDGTLSTEITIFVDGSEHTKLHTSCSKPIGPGLMSGDFLVVEGSSRNGGPLCPLGGDSGSCSPSGAVSLEFHNREVKWEITNTGTGTLTIDRITLTWPSENGNLKKVKLGKKTIYDDQLPPPTATIDSGWKGGGKDREIKSEKTEELKFEFVHDAVPGSFVSDRP